MSERNYIDVSMQPDFAVQLQEVGIVPPTIRISDTLLMRMQRHQRTLLFDDLNLMDGVREIESERPMVLYFDSHHRDSEEIAPQVSFDWPRTEETPKATLRITPNFTESDESDGAYRKLDVALWSSVLINQAIAEGQAEQFLTEKRVSADEHSFLRRWSVPILGNMAIVTLLEPISHISAIVAEPVALGTQMAMYGFMTHRRGRLARMSDDDYMKYRLSDRAEEMATRYPVMRQGFRFGDDPSLV